MSYDPYYRQSHQRKEYNRSQLGTLHTARQTPATHGQHVAYEYPTSHQSQPQRHQFDIHNQRDRQYLSTTNSDNRTLANNRRSGWSGWSSNILDNSKYSSFLKSTADSPYYDAPGRPQRQAHDYISLSSDKIDVPAYPYHGPLQSTKLSSPTCDDNNNEHYSNDFSHCVPHYQLVSAQQCRRIPVGLRNIGNTCYFNSIMQNLYQTFLLERGLRYAAKCRRSCYTSPLTESLLEFYDSMTSLSCGGFVQPYNPSQLFNELCNRSSRFAGGRQQDSHELLRHLMDAVKEEEKLSLNDKLKQLTVVDRVFGGHYLTVFHCKDCSTPYHLFEPFLDISLPVNWETQRKLSSICHFNRKRHSNSVKPAPYSEYALKIDEMTKFLAVDTKRPTGREQRTSVVHPGSLVNSLSFYTRAEDLNEYMCLECNKGLQRVKFTKATKQTIIYNPPAVLTIHLKRFEQSKHGYTKSNNAVEFEESLDLSQFCSQYSMRQTESGRIVYQLYGVVLHSGTLHGGHYTALVRVRQPDVERTAAFLQETFMDRDEFMSRDKLIELVRDGARNKLYVPHSSSSNNNNKSTDDVWYKISDSCVERTDAVLNHKSDVYLLFYERIS